MKKILFFFLIISFPIQAEIVTAIGKHRHLGNVSTVESCKIAEEKAKKEAIIKTIGQTISSNVVSNCSEIDGEYDCERNQFSLFELNADVTGSKIINRDDGKELGNDDIQFCEIEIEAEVLPIKRNEDPTFQFDVNLNQRVYRSGEPLEININTSKDMYIAIFQWLPYGGTTYNKVTKIFPNEEFNKNTNDLVKNQLNLKYEVYFPPEIKKEKVDEYLVFVASEKQIPWLDEYSQIESLKSQMIKNKILMENHYTGYIVIK